MDKGAIEPSNPKWQKDKNKTDAKTSKAYIQSIKQFLSEFKTKPCAIYNEHNFSLCYFHHEFDQRRNPYLQDSFLYYPKHQLPQYLNQDNKKIPSQCVNEAEFLYHPIMYKKQHCVNFYKCPHNLFCAYLHSHQKKLLQYGQFFRFDINTHKTKLCTKRDYHERKVCIYYHNDMDKRRSNFNEYSHEMCEKKNCQKKNCSYSHNKIQQVYHPSRFKSKFCQVYHNKSAKCQYKEFCAFAHSQEEIKVQIIHLLTRDQNFYQYKYKTVWCPNTEYHERATCVYAHNIQDFRRNPIQYKYKPQKCSDWKFEDSIKSIEDSGCKKGMKCDKSHGWMEPKYHPLKEKKGKQVLNEKTMQIIEKKLINEKNPTKSKGISNVVEGKCLDTNKGHHHGIGIPFFKKQPNLSESSRKTRGITTNIESDDSYAKDNQVQKQEEKQIQTDVRKNNMFLFAQDHIWRNEQDENNEFERKLNEERARSENKFDDCETVYSHSLKETVGNSNILRKLKNNNINGVKIKNLSKEQISDFCFLNQNEKEILSHKVRLYHLKRQRNPILYSIQISKFFIRRKKQQILEKTQSKKIKEEQLLGLKAKQIQKYDFLTVQERTELPLLLEEYKKFMNENQFNQINQEIFKFVSPKQQRMEK